MEKLTFEEMVEFLAQFAQDREPSDVALAMRRTAIERELMLKLGAEAPDAERRSRVRVPGHLPAFLHIGGESAKATVRDLGEGGVRVTTVLSPALGAVVELELLPTSNLEHHPPQAATTVVWQRAIESSGFELGLRFIDDTDGHRRRMRRLIIDILRALPL